MAKTPTRSRTKAPAAATASDTFAARTEPAADQPQDMGTPDLQSQSMGSEPSEEDVRLRAYQRYLERGGGHGMDFEDWLEAERELKKRK
jgi:hypothetical protein